MNYDGRHIASSTKFSNNEKVLIQRTTQAIYYQSYLSFRYILPLSQKVQKIACIEVWSFKTLGMPDGRIFLLDPSIRSIG